MKTDGFGATLVFGALAGAAWPLVALVGGPLLGTGATLALHLVACGALYAASLARGRVRAIGAALTVAAIAAIAMTLVRGPGGAAIGAAIGIAVARSALLQRRSGARAIAVEVALVGGGLALARFVAAPGALGVALGLWGFFLVQSTHFLIGGLRERAPAAAADRFEAARRRVIALLEADS